MRNKSGFTIIELMIATSIFTIILLLALFGFLQIGRLFYKGVNISQTTNNGNQIVSSIKDDIAFSAAGSVPIKVTTGTGPASSGYATRGWFCAGPNRYSFLLGRELDTTKESTEMQTVNDPNLWSSFGLLRDRMSNAASCPNPFTSLPPNNLTAAAATEMLGNKMRLSNLTITQVAASDPALKNMYTLDVYIAYGDDDLFVDPNATAAKCQSGINYSTYCFWSDFRTNVRQGVN